MILAAPLVIPFAEAIGLSVATLGIAKASDMVNEYIQENPEQSMKIFQMIMPSQGIANALKNKSSEDVEEVEESEIFMNKEKISLEDLDEMTDEEAADLPNEDKAELMKQAGKKRDRELSIATSEKLSLSGPGKEKIDIEREIDERVDPGGIQKEKKGYDFRDYIPKGAYKKRYADGGAIGIEVLFENKNPRQGLFMGGSPLEGQALNIYNSMNAYGFDDQAIANALTEQGLYTPGGTTPDPTPDAGQTIGYQGGSDNFSPYNPDPNTIQSFKTDPRIAAANEADVRTKQLTSMGINDPFANEASLSGAYYGDMPTDTSNQIGKQSMFAKAKQGLTGLMDNPLVNLISNSTPFGMAKNLFKGIGSKMPVNQRAIQENVMGNLGFAVNDIGQIVSTGDYNDPENVMAGYNLNRMTVDTFKNRIDKIRNRKIAQTAASRARIKAVEEAQRKFELGERLAREEKQRAEAARKGQTYTGDSDRQNIIDSSGRRDATGGDPGSRGASDQFSNRSGRGRTGYSDGGLVTMFKEKR